MSTGNGGWSVKSGFLSQIDSPNQWRAADASGDGIPDMVRVEQQASTLAVWTIQKAPARDLLVSISNNMGRTTNLQYQPSSSWAANNPAAGCYLPLGSVLDTIAQVTVHDDRTGANDPETFSYGCARWSAQERMFLGWQDVTATRGAQPNRPASVRVNHYRAQDVGLMEPLSTALQDTSGKVFEKTTLVYQSGGAPLPYRSLVQTRQESQCNQTTTCALKETYYAYDGFGNVTTTTEYYGPRSAGRARETRRTYIAAAGPYLVSLPASEALFDRNGGAAAELRRTLLCYDGDNSGCSQAPSRGLLTASKAWNNQGNTYVTTTNQYDQYGNLTKVIDANANATTTDYDATYHLYPTRICNALNQCATQEWSSTFGKRTKLTDPSNLITTWAYDTLGRLSRTISPSGLRVDTVYYDIGGPLNSQRVTEFVYPNNGPAIWSDRNIDGMNRTWKTVQGFGDKIIVQEFDFVAASTQLSRQTHSFYYPGEQQAYEVYQYDAAGRQFRQTHPDGTTLQWSYGNDAERQWVTATDERGNQRTQYSDTFGRTVKVRQTTSVASDTTYSYDMLDRLTNVTDGAGNTLTTITWDSLGRKLRSQDADRGIWTYAYDNIGNLVSQTDARGIVTTFNYDTVNRPTRKATFRSAFSESFDTRNTFAWGWGANQTVPFNDGGNNVVKSTGTGSDFSAQFYRAADSLSDGKALQLRFKVDSPNTDAHVYVEANDTIYRRFSVRANGGKLYAQYIADGTNWVWPGDVLPNLQLNTWYVLTIKLDDANGFTAEAYQENNPTVRGSYRAQMPVGKTWRFVHLIRQDSAYVDDYQEFGFTNVASPLTSATYRYDEAGHGPSIGRLTSVLDSTGAGCPSGISEDLRYDSAGNLAARQKCITGKSYQMSFGYDNLGRMTSATYPDGEVVNYSFDAAGRLSSAINNSNLAYIRDLSYSAAGQPRSATYGNGAVASYSYDPQREWLTSASVTAGGATLYQAQYSYLPNGLIRSSTSSTNQMNQTYTYDNLDRLTAVSGDYAQSFAYDTLGNLTSNSALGAYTYPAYGPNGCGSGVQCPRPHAVQQAGSRTYTYDAVGNMTSSIDSTAPTSARSIVWNADNLPAEVRIGDALRLAAQYDASGERVLVQRGADTTRYFGIYLEESAAALTRYYYAGGQLVARRDAGGVSWYHQDHLGSTRVLSNASGQVVQRYDYTPFGETRDGAGAARTDIQYTGQRAEADVGLIHMRARSYDPQLGRFISADSIVPRPYDPQALNRYSYVYSNPINYTDPTGHETEVNPAKQNITCTNGGGCEETITVVAPPLLPPDGVSPCEGCFKDWARRAQQQGVRETGFVKSDDGFTVNFNFYDAIGGGFTLTYAPGIGISGGFEVGVGVGMSLEMSPGGQVFVGDPWSDSQAAFFGEVEGGYGPASVSIAIEAQESLAEPGTFQAPEVSGKACFVGCVSFGNGSGSGISSYRADQAARLVPLPSRYQQPKMEGAMEGKAGIKVNFPIWSFQD
jgi:RHS repeat-associated protein